MNHDRYEDDFILDVLERTRTVAMVGASPKWNRPSYFVMKYLLDRGFEVHPVNPRAAGDTILGRRVYGDLDEVPGPFEMVDVFRNSEAAGPIVDDAIRLAPDKGIRFVWMQLTVRNDEAAARAEGAGLQVVMNRCPKIEWSRLHGELSWGGIDSGVVTSRRMRLR
ncbi:MAG: CoA-binding protein [Myxococcota bacterium]